jgi:hypothetical protein
MSSGKGERTFWSEQGRPFGLVLIECLGEKNGKKKKTTNY